ncbi:uncharacterized protein [Nicotiana tomentosiformis]|uniref:uncharacterized protein n=1 Tax=Nicotiana tomentosiformis TaxID=4098 RepID=UPI00388C448E
MTDNEQRRLERFGRLQPPSFSGAKSENAQDFLDRCQRILRTAGILETSGVSFITFQFTGAAFIWWEAYEMRMPVGTAPLTWYEFSVLFLEKFMPQSRREELSRQFEQLHQNGMSVTQYEIRFSQLDHHTVWLVPTNRERISSFIDGLTYQLWFLMTGERVSGATFDEVVDIARKIEMVCSQEREEREANRPRSSGDPSGVHFGGQSYHSRGRPYRPAQMACPAHRGASSSNGSHNAHPGHSSLSALLAQSSSHAPLVWGSFEPGSSSGYSGSRGSIQSLPPLSDRCCYECGELGHIRRQCPRLLGGPIQ